MTDSGYIDFIMDKLSSIQTVSTKKMFGGNVIHMAGRVMGFVFGDDFLFEPGPTIERLMPDARRMELFPGSKLFFVIDETISAAKLCELANACYEDFPISKPRKRKGQTKQSIKAKEKEILERFPFSKHIKD